jgi:hypothetical protein
MEGFFQNQEQDEAGHADGVHAHAGPKQACCDSRVSYPLEPREGFQREPLDHSGFHTFAGEEMNRSPKGTASSTIWSGSPA